MIKIILLVKRKPELSAAAFRDHYENHHVPLIKEHFGRHYRSYRRNYPLATPGSQDSSGGRAVATSEDTYDCITEMCFDNAEAMQAMFAAAAVPPLNTVIGGDEDNFIDRARMRMLICEVVGDT